MFSFHTKKKLVSSYSSGLKNVFGKLCFRDVLVWTEGLTAGKNSVFKFLRPSVHGALISIDFYDFYLSIFSLVLVSIEKIYQTLKTVLDHISKHRRISSQMFRYASRRIFNSLLGV